MKKNIDISTYLNLCDPHQGIIHEFGIDSNCKLNASICKKGCPRDSHLKKSIKHEFVPAK